MTDYIIPLFFLIIFSAAVYKKIPVYDTFIAGAKNALSLAADVFPYIATIMIAISLLRVSGLTAAFTDLLSPVLGTLGIPGELVELVLLKPFSGSGSTALLADIISTNGADSYVARAASVLMGTSETIFYISAVYFSSSKVKKTGWGLPIALISCLVGSIVACLLCRVI